MSPRSWTYLAILLGLLFHGALLPFTYGQTYDAYIHMFFGNHYQASWFDPWETRWYTGFTVTAYPPGSHQALGLMMNVVDMRVAFIMLQLLAIALLITGVFRFSRLWVNDQASAYAALLCAFATSLSETLHIFGQLPTVLSIALFLNAIPHISAWIEFGRKRAGLLALTLTAAATSVHHVTPLFGTVFFVAPVGLAAWLSNLKTRETQKPEGDVLSTITWALPGLLRGIAIGLAMLFLIITIVFPYWHWSLTDPITQVSIPHGSRENFLAKPNLGLIFFVIPWGLLIFVVPYVLYKSLRSSLWPLGIAVLIALFLGTGGTTPLPRILLGPAFEILTLDRFTFWASILILPFAGLGVQSLWGGRAHDILTRAFGAFLSRAGLVFLIVTYVSLAISTALLPSVRPTQPKFIDPAPLVKFMSEDRHSDWRYLTLGFGDQFAYHSALIDAESVDGNYHSARRLPSLMNYSVERLENSKYAGVPGLASLNQFLINAEKFHLKYVFSNDEFYDPVLHYTGWNPVTRLSNGIRVWEKPDISPLPAIRPRRDLPHYQKVMWGTLPIGALGLGLLTLLGLALTQKLISGEARPFHQGPGTAAQITVSTPVIAGLRLFPLFALLAAIGLLHLVIKTRNAPLTPQAVIARYYQHLDFREPEDAFALIAPKSEFDYGQFLRIQKLTGGLVPSFGKLTAITPLSTEIRTPKLAHVRAQLDYLTSVGMRPVIVEMELQKGAKENWQINYQAPSKDFGQKLTATTTTPEIRDLTGQRLLTPTDPVQRLARPKVTLMAAEFIQRDGRLYVAGRMRNISEFPACVKIAAQTEPSSAPDALTQHSGRLGAHRLLPGEDTAFRIDFEGYLKIQDQDYNAGYDPEYFSVAEIDRLPKAISLAISTTVCAPPAYKALSFSDLEIQDGGSGPVLSAKIKNSGTEIVSTLQLKISYLDNQGRLAWVQPYYLQHNLLPGEERTITTALSALPQQENIDIEAVTINGKAAKVMETAPWPAGIVLPSGEGQIVIDYDAMLYQPLD